MRVYLYVVIVAVPVFYGLNYSLVNLIKCIFRGIFCDNARGSSIRAGPSLNLLTLLKMRDTNLFA